MKHISLYIIAIITTMMTIAPASAHADEAKGNKVESNRNERNAIRKGNKLFEEKRYAEALKAHPGCDILIRMAEGTIYHRWVPEVLDDAVPFTAGFVMEDGQIMAADDERGL